MYTCQWVPSSRVPLFASVPGNRTQEAGVRRNRHVARVELEMSWMINTLVILMMVRSLEPWCDSSRFWKEHPNYPSFRHSLKQVLYFLHSRFSVDNWHLCFFSITCGSGQSAAEILQSRKSNSTVCNGRRSQTRDSERKLLSTKDEMKESCQGALGVKIRLELGVRATIQWTCYPDISAPP